MVCKTQPVADLSKPWAVWLSWLDHCLRPKGHWSELQSGHVYGCRFDPWSARLGEGNESMFLSQIHVLLPAPYPQQSNEKISSGENLKNKCLFKIFSRTCCASSLTFVGLGFLVINGTAVFAPQGSAEDQIICAEGIAMAVTFLLTGIWVISSFGPFQITLM